MYCAFMQNLLVFMSCVESGLWKKGKPQRVDGAERDGQPEGVVHMSVPRHQDDIEFLKSQGFCFIQLYGQEIGLFVHV
jgi:hypothetical protein